MIRVENGFLAKSFTPEALDAMSAYRWPGNIRELRNVVERLVILGGPNIDLEDLPSEIRTASGAAHLPAGTEAPFRKVTWEQFKAASERGFLIAMLKACDGNISEAARVLAVERTTVHKWLKAYDIEKRHYLV